MKHMRLLPVNNSPIKYHHDAYSEYGPSNDANPLIGLTQELDVTYKELATRRAALLEERRSLTHSLKAYKNDLALIFQGQKEVEHVLQLEKQKEQSLLNEVA